LDLEKFEVYLTHVYENLFYPKFDEKTASFSGGYMVATIFESDDEMLLR